MTTQTTKQDLTFSDLAESRQFLQTELNNKQARLATLTLASDPLERAKLQSDIAEIMLEIADHGMPEASWGLAKESFMIYVEAEQWEEAVYCCDILYRTEQAASVVALGNGIWLAVTYPIDTELSIMMLNNLIDDTPKNSDGAAVAAAVAHYIADLRLTDKKRKSVMFLTSNILHKVAERHSEVKNQQAMNLWMHRLGLLDPAVFLPRLGMVLNAITDNQWWYEQDKLRAKLPVH